MTDRKLGCPPSRIPRVQPSQLRPPSSSLLWNITGPDFYLAQREMAMKRCAGHLMLCLALSATSSLFAGEVTAGTPFKP